MRDIDTQVGKPEELIQKPSIQAIDVASQHVKGSMEWLLELLGKGKEISPEMREIHAEQAQQLLAVLKLDTEIEENIPLSEAELSEIKKYIESDKKNTWKGRDKTVKNENGQAETPLDFYKRVYGKWIPRLTKGQLLHIDKTLYGAFNRWTLNGKNIIPRHILPSFYNRHKGIEINARDIEGYKRVHAKKYATKKV